ncbi:DUF523 domain-containing protein [Anaerococcus lactolyticus]|uniref:DUF523 domain-containing protein n=1 Tax=Anaerococcus lactolyticus TaxID=33032 RepID=UPI0023F2B947|nr:DUF523 domain-containing protein [Anaerococcus lactolyticus]
MMKIGVSACLLGENCKYNGKNNFSSKLEEILKNHDLVAICPEVLGGLPTPRDPAEIVGEIVRTKDGRSVDDEFKKGAKKALELIKRSKVELVVLQSRSPSCGIGKIYDGSFTGKLINGDGIFAKLLKEEGIKAIDVEDLTNI